MIGTKSSSTDNYTDNEFEFGFPIQLVVSSDKPVFLQFKRRVSLPADQRTEKGDSPDQKVVDVNRSRLTWDLADVEFPAGDYKFGNVHGMRFKTAESQVATVYVIQIQQEDPEIQAFSPSA